MQGGLAGLGGQALGQTRVDGREAGTVGGDEALCRGEVAGQGVGGQVRGCRQGGHLALQGRDGGGVGAYVGGVLGACLRGVYWVRTRLSCPAEMPCNSITGGSVTPSSRTRPVRVEGNNDISISPEQTRRCPRG